MVCHCCRNEYSPNPNPIGCLGCYVDISDPNIWCDNCSDSLKICRICQEPERKWRNEHKLEGYVRYTKRLHC